jgi:hypothetical protein
MTSTVVNIFSKSLVASALVASTLIASTQHVQAQQPSLSFVEIGYGQTELEGILSDDETFTGFNVAASYEVSNNLYFPISYYRYSADESDREVQTFGDIRETFGFETEVALSELTIGIGYKFDISDSSILATDFSYLDLTVDIDASSTFLAEDTDTGQVLNRFSDSSSGDIGENGFALRSTFQTLFDNGVQLNVGLQHKVIRIDGESLDDTLAVGELMYFVNDQFAVKVGAYAGDDTQFAITGRYVFN